MAEHNSSAVPQHSGDRPQSGDGRCPAFLFDLDGTLVDSVYQHVLAWQEASRRWGLDWPCGGFTAGSA